METKTKRIICKCSKLPKGAEKFTDAEGIYIMTHPQHEMIRDLEHYDYRVYRCLNCGAEKTEGSGKLKE